MVCMIVRTDGVNSDASAVGPGGGRLPLAGKSSRAQGIKVVANLGMATKSAWARSRPPALQTNPTPGYEEGVVRIGRKHSHEWKGAEPRVWNLIEPLENGSRPAPRPAMKALGAA